MSKVYKVESGAPVQLSRVHCANESAELQDLLDRNPEILPGDYIDPDNERRWLVVGREMPVPDRYTGDMRWNLDFLFADQDATPTFIECKRFKSPAARREIVGQMLEYAANAHLFWTADLLRQTAETTAARRIEKLQTALGRLGAEVPLDDPSSYFKAMEQNLREGNIRLVFFLEEAPSELKTLVEFLNKQMSTIEVMLVEVQQFDDAGNRYLVPRLFGYSEDELRQKVMAATTKGAAGGQRRAWDEASVFAELRTVLGPREAEVRAFYEKLLLAGCTMGWGTGRVRGSFSARLLSVHDRSLLTVYTNGELSLNYYWLNSNHMSTAACERLKVLIHERTGFPLPISETSGQKFEIDHWLPKAAGILAAVSQLAAEYPPPAADQAPDGASRTPT